MNVEVVPAGPEHRPLIEGLFQLYAHDFSEFEPSESSALEVDERGGFRPYAHMDAYWREPDRVPLLITVDGRTAGFALLNAHGHSGRPVDRNMAEFFILRKYRRGGVGREAMRQILTRFPGQWEIAIAARNTPALKFWPDAVAAVPGVSEFERIDGDGVEWRGPIFRCRVSG